MGTKVGYPAPALVMNDLDKLVAFLRQDAHANNGVYRVSYEISEDQFVTVWGQLCLAAKNLSLPHADVLSVPSEFKLCSVAIRIKQPLILPQIGSEWRHAKSSVVYKVLAHVRFENNSELGIMYAAVFHVAGEVPETGIHWVRPLSEWYEKFTQHDEIYKAYLS
jgi:hypothetical protein